MSKFYEISQNNSGGSFDVDDKVCHRLIIEANSEKEAESIAEDLGCYWDGVDNQQDCSCCGDRWYRSFNDVNIEEINQKWGGSEVSQWQSDSGVDRKHAVEEFKAKYPDAEWLTQPFAEDKYGSVRVLGKIKLRSIEEYAQVMADQYGWTKPDIRIFYKGGEVKEIFSKKVK